MKQTTCPVSPEKQQGPLGGVGPTVERAVNAVGAEAGRQTSPAQTHWQGLKKKKGALPVLMELHQLTPLYKG